MIKIKLKKSFFKIIAILLSVYLAVIIFMFFNQKSYLYFPDRQNFFDCPQFSESQKIIFQGTRFYYTPVSQKLVVFYHGNAGSACDRGYLKDLFKQWGYSSIFVEYAGYASDSKKPSQKLMTQDAENINLWLKTTEHKKPALAGESLGTWFALYHSTLVQDSKLLLISPFFDMAEVAQKHYPWLPIKLLLTEKYQTKNFRPLAKEILIVHGGKDEIIPIKQSKKLFGNLDAANKNFEEISNAEHNDILDFPQTLELIKNFLEK